MPGCHVRYIEYIRWVVLVGICRHWWGRCPLLGVPSPGNMLGDFSPSTVDSELRSHRVTSLHVSTIFAGASLAARSLMNRRIALVAGIAVVAIGAYWWLRGEPATAPAAAGRSAK